ncbi:unnamed protein product [Paramecium octaurelia]|uniref:Transmembrane protein n=1 Tax=Paramecium octaurelia TaxID=43137 RepID=A0A8S1X523_PAROT|nr:unnamed protein product [Paramecium octaurelia]
MKSLIVTENCRRTKTNPDQTSIVSYSTNKSCASSERKTQVKVACKVLSEMREDESSKLAMKFTQLRIVLATQSLLHILQKYRSAKMQTYFWIIQQERKIRPNHYFYDLTQPISLPRVIDDISNHYNRQLTQQDSYQQMPNATTIVLCQILNKIVMQQQKSTFKRIKEPSNIYKAITQITKFINQCQNRFQYLVLFNIMRSNQNRKICKTSVLDQNHEILSEEEQYEQSIVHPDEFSIKEQLAIKFASTTIITSILNEKIRKLQFALLFNMMRGQFQNKQLSLMRTNEITQIHEQSYLDDNPTLRGSSHLCSVVYKRLSAYLQDIKTFQFDNELQIGDSLNTLILHKHSEESHYNSYGDLYTQRIVLSQYRNEEEENDSEIRTLENSKDFKMPCSLQHITDIEIEESTNEGEQKTQNTEKTQQKIKNKNQDLIKNAVKSYCKMQKRKHNQLEGSRTLQMIESREKEMKKVKYLDRHFYILSIIGLCMITLIFLILQ